ncbi:putative polyamine oxidase 5 [Apium graveolens]|uniref:putative polyamine oxidase 5 n=1 Tax=Apium graveolens TaxID=4045 RepID=UPI003D7BC906
MASRKPRIVIIGAGMAGLTAANKLFKAQKQTNAFELCVVEGGSRIGGRINTCQLGGDTIELGATWIHGIQNSPVYKIAQEINALNSDQPWERMDGFVGDSVTIAEGGFVLDSSVVDRVSSVFKSLLAFVRGKNVECDEFEVMKCGLEFESVGCFLRKGLEEFLGSVKNVDREVMRCGDWNEEMLIEAVFRKYEHMLRSYYSADDLKSIDFEAEKEFSMFPGEEITIARGYFSVIESLASVLPQDLIQSGWKVEKIEWRPSGFVGTSRPVKLLFSDGSVLEADHVIVTVSLGVLKAGILDDSGMFFPPLPDYKTEAISKLGYGVVDKLFLQLNQSYDRETDQIFKFPFLEMVFHDFDSETKDPEIPWWIRKTSSLSPIYSNSSVLLSWFAGKEALALESLSDEEILNKVSTTVSSFLSNSRNLHNGNSSSLDNYTGEEPKFTTLLKSQWGTDPLFLGSYSYVAVGSSGYDIEKLAEPLPENSSLPSLQILFAGEATHRTHYSTTHGAYLSGLREAERLLQHYKCIEDI